MAQAWQRADFTSPNRLVPAYLTASYLYYLQPDEMPIMTDELYDWVCKELDRQWDQITHPHKSAISRDDLKAGTGFALRMHDYPLVVRVVAMTMSRTGLKEPQLSQFDLFSQEDASTLFEVTKYRNFAASSRLEGIECPTTPPLGSLDGGD